jgi:hypothetical protein
MFPLGFLSGLKVHEIRVGYDIELIVSTADWGAGPVTEIQIEGPCVLRDPDRTEHRVKLSKPDSIPPLFRLHSRVINKAWEEGGAFLAAFDDGSLLGVPPDAGRRERTVTWRLCGPDREPRAWTRVVGGLRDELRVWDPWFELALAQAIAWCTPRADVNDPANSLRSPSLRPKVLGEDAVSGVVTNRGYSDPAVEAATEVQSAADLRGGRLLVSFPDEELADGAAEAESDGFFDGYDAPPWDTWVALLERDSDRIGDFSGPHLVSWVPPTFLDLAAAGMEVSSVPHIKWLEDIDVPLRAQLRERGVIS